MSFRAWADRGFPDILPIIPPGAELSAFSRLDSTQIGRVPGRRNAYGLWTGLQNWLNIEPNPALWDTWGASVGLRTKHFPAVDIDVLDRDLALQIARLALDILGDAPVRVGRAPKCALVYRAPAPFRRMRLRFRKDGVSHLVEILGDGQQFVVEGVHAGTGKPYQWDRDFTAADLNTITAEQAGAYLDAADALLRSLGWETKREGSSGGAPVAQDDLKGDPAAIREAVAALPNTSDLFPDRDDYLRVGYAVKAALAGEVDAFDVWWAWCQKWEGNTNGPNTEERARADWDRMHPPFQIGAEYLLDLAQELGVEAPGRAQDEFADGQGLRVADPPFEQSAGQDGGAVAPGSEAAEIGIVFSDAWFTNRFILEHGAIARYCGLLGGWHRWERYRWVQDKIGWLTELAGRSMRTAAAGAEKTPATRAASRATRVAVMDYASVDPRVALCRDQFDADPWTLNTPGGIVDLRTGRVGPSDPARLFRMSTAVAPARGCPSRWLTFLDEATGGDLDLMAYLQRLAGYALTGSTEEHVLAFLWGTGGNGKGTFLNTLRECVGDYAKVASMDVFVSSKFTRHSVDVADLAGARLVTAQETEEGRSWDEVRIKSLTGGDAISARFMRENYFTFTPQFTLIFTGNNKPRIHSLDDAMRRRFHMVPFTNKPETLDRKLAEKLRTEWPQILQWAIDGTLAWQQTGLAPPLAVRSATEDYFADEDPLSRWLEERTRPDNAPHAGVETTVLWGDWVTWCHAHGEPHGTQPGFRQTLAARGWQKWAHPTTRRHGVSGLRLLAADEMPVTEMGT